jgi:hypothetical protein
MTTLEGRVLRWELGLLATRNLPLVIRIDGLVGSTMMMCTKEAAIVQEAAYLTNFEATIILSALQDIID